MGDSPKWVKSKRRKRREKKKKKKTKVGDNNGQATHGARKHAWCTQAAWAKILFSYILTELKSESLVRISYRTFHISCSEIVTA